MVRVRGRHCACPYYVPKQLWFNNVSYMQDKQNRHNFFYRSNHSAYIICRIKIYVSDITTTDILYTIHFGMPKLFFRFFQKMTVGEFFGLYKALNATSERVLDLINEPGAMNSAERIFSYLITFVSNSRQDDLRLFLRFVTGSSVLLGESIRVSFNNTESLARSPTAKTCSCAIELLLSYSTYPKFEQKLSKVLSSEGAWAMDTI